MALDKSGQVAEQGSFDELSAAGGYVSSFSLPRANWDEKPDEDEDSGYGKEVLQAAKYVYCPHVTQDTQELEAEASRQTGDTSIYLYYVGSVGWVAAIIFAVAISGFIFGMTFPSKSHPASRERDEQ